MGTDGPARRRFLGLLGGAAAGGGLAMGGVARAGSGGPGSGTGGRGLVYLGTYADPGLLVARADRRTGDLTVTDVVEGVPQPSFLAVPPRRRGLYAASEVADGQVYAFGVGAGGSPEVLNHQPTGGSPAHLSVHPSGRYVLSANYFGGSVAVHPIRPDGSVGPMTDLVRHEGSGPHPDQAEPHAHQIVTDPRGRFVLAVDLGTDTVYVYRLDLDAGRLHERSRARMRPGAGPRHLAFHPDGRTVYVINELDSTVTVCGYDARRGVLRPGQVVSTVPPGTGANFPGEILVSPDGRYVYGTNRGHNSVAIFEVGRGLTPAGTVPCGGDWPRHMELAAGGRLLYVANQRSGQVSAFRVSGARLIPIGTPLVTTGPACVLPRF